MALPLWLRGMGSRPATTVLIFLLSVVAVMTAVLGPLLLRAVHQSALQDGVAAAGLDGTSITVSARADGESDLDSISRLTDQPLLPTTGGPDARIWRAPQHLYRSTANGTWNVPGRPAKASSRVNAVDDGCAAFKLTAGRCPEQSGETLASRDDARRLNLRVGTRVDFVVPPRTRPLTIVGFYDAVASTDIPLARVGSADGTRAVVTGDPLVVNTNELSRMRLETDVASRLLLRDGMTVDDERLARSTLVSVTAELSKPDLQLVLDTKLPQLLDELEGQVRAAQTLIAVNVIQALALAMFALSVVVQRIGHARTAEWGIGRLRGIGRFRWLGSIYAEPAIALLAGVPVGIAAGVGVARLTVTAALRPGTPVDVLRTPVLLAAAAAVVGSVVALVAVSARSVRRPLIELIQQRSESRRLSRTGAVAQTAVILLAATALYQLLTGGLLSDQGSQLGLLAPALFALALAVIAVRVAVLVVRRVTTRPPRSIVALVVGRQAARTPTTMNPAIVIAAGVAMSIFASQVLGLSLRNQSLRADAVVGAATVLHVGVPKGLDLGQTVRAADPGGRSAMAVQEKALSSDGGTSRIVAVDSSRLAAVSSWPTRWSGLADTDLAAALKPPTQPAVILRGTKVVVRFADVRVDLAPPQAFAEVPPTEDSPPVLSLVVDGGSAWQTIFLASLSNDTRVAAAELPCPKGCRVVGLAIGSEPGHAYTAGFTVTGMSTDQQPEQSSSPWLQGAGRWQPRVGDQTDPEPISSATPRGTASGLQVKAFDWAGGNPTRVLVADVVDPMPALVGPDTTEQPFPGRESTALGTGLDGQAQLIKVVGHAAVLPRSLTDGVLVDLDNARRLVDPAANEAGSEVWLGPDAPASIEQALTKAGLTIAGRELLSDELDRLDHQAMTRGALVAVTVGYAALALALLTLVAARLADAERRRADWASLRDAGLNPRTVRWLAAVEIAGPALLGVVIGVLSGVVGILLAAARLPLVDTATPGPPLDLRVDWSPVVTLVVVSALVVAAVAAIGAAAETRGGRR